MTNSKSTAQELEEFGLIGIIRADKSEHVVDAIAALQRGGIRAVEITLNTPNALELIAATRRKLGDGMRVGAGTILEPADAIAAIEAGSEFIVTPTLQCDTIAVCRERNIPIACGCATPTESLAAHRAGADFIKVFPAESLGLGYIKAIRGPLPFLKLMPTGGVSLENMATFIQAGCVGIGLGGNLVSKRILQEQDWDGLTALAAKFVQVLADARSHC